MSKRRRREPLEPGPDPSGGYPKEFWDAFVKRQQEAEAKKKAEAKPEVKEGEKAA